MNNQREQLAKELRILIYLDVRPGETLEQHSLRVAAYVEKLLIEAKIAALQNAPAGLFDSRPYIQDQIIALRKMLEEK